MTRLERLAPFLFFLACVLGTFAALMADEVPYAVIAGIYRVESATELARDGAMVPGVRRDGAAREVGLGQLSPVVCRQWHLDRDRCRWDDRYCLAAVLRHLLWLRSHTRSWDEAVRAYNGGLSGRNRPAAVAYAARVKAAGAL